MATLTLNRDSTSPVDVVVRESDLHSESVLLKLTRSVLQGTPCGCSEVFMTPSQLDHLGRFLIRQAEEIRISQEMRD